MQVQQVYQIKLIAIILSENSKTKINLKDQLDVKINILKVSSIVIRINLGKRGGWINKKNNNEWCLSILILILDK